MVDDVTATVVSYVVPEVERRGRCEQTDEAPLTIRRKMFPS